MILGLWSGRAARLLVPVKHTGIEVASGAFLLLGTLVFGSVLVVQNTKQTALHATETRLQNAASVVTNAINRQLLQVDGALISLPGLFAANSDQKKRELGR
jgi:hypothetical protein